MPESSSTAVVQSEILLWFRLSSRFKNSLNLRDVSAFHVLIAVILDLPRNIAVC